MQKTAQMVMYGDVSDEEDLDELARSSRIMKQHRKNVSRIIQQEKQKRKKPVRRIKKEEPMIHEDELPRIDNTAIRPPPVPAFLLDLQQGEKPVIKKSKPLPELPTMKKLEF